MRPGPLVPLLRAGYGTALIVAPGPMLAAGARLSSSSPPSRAARRTTQVVGLRHVIQAAITLRFPATEVVAIGVLVDLTHSVSMVGFAAVNRPLARAELTDSLIAATLAVTEAVLLNSR